MAAAIPVVPIFPRVAMLIGAQVDVGDKGVQVTSAWPWTRNFASNRELLSAPFTAIRTVYSHQWRFAWAPLPFSSTT